MDGETAIDVPTRPVHAGAPQSARAARWIFMAAGGTSALIDLAMAAIFWIFVRPLLPMLYTLVALFLASRACLTLAVGVLEPRPHDVMPHRTLVAHGRGEFADYARLAVAELMGFLTLPTQNVRFQWLVAALVYAPICGLFAAVALDVVAYAAATAHYSLALSILINLSVMFGVLAESLACYALVVYCGIVIPRDMAKSPRSVQ
jgi:hypothetical protein